MDRVRRWDVPAPDAGARPDARDVRLILAFVAVYAFAAFLARQTMLPTGGVSLVWPAAGVSVVWLVARAGRAWRWLDAIAIALTTYGVVTVTGSGPVTGLAGAAAATLQAVVCAWVVSRTCPGVWAGRSFRPVGAGELWWFVTGAVVGAIVAAPLAALAVTLTSGTWSWDVVLLWTARNVVAIVTVGTLWFVVAAWLASRRTPASAPSVSPARQAPLRVAALLLAPAVYVAWFLALDDLALVFPLIAITVWVGSQASSALVVVHNTVVAGTAITLTVAGTGPFLQFSDPTTQVAVAQLFVGLTTVIGLSLALAREERVRLLHEVAVARDRAESQAALLTTIVDTMAEGVRVVDPTGRVIVRNPAATRLLTGLPHLPLDDDAVDLVGITRLDGSPLTESELPFRRALNGQTVRDLELLVQTPGAPGPRVVAFSSERLPEESGGGAVTVLRDVTAERDQLRRAARVQAGLLPAHVPELEGWEVAARFIPAGSVGGDFYDWDVTDDGLVVTVADVMGKGPAAAILAATTRSVLQAQGPGADVAGALDAAERAMTGDLTKVATFVTVFRGHVDLATGALTYADAGHGLTLLIGADGRARRLPANGLPLGVGLEDRRTASTEHLEPGDLLLVLSDGVLDAAGGSLQDLARLERAAGTGRRAADAVGAVLALTGTAAQEDDLTVVAVRRTTGAGGPTVGEFVTQSDANSPDVDA